MHTLLKQSLKHALRGFFQLAYRARIHGIEHYTNAGERTLIISHHTSRLDSFLLAAFLPDEIRFVTDPNTAQRLWCKCLNVIMPVFVLDPENPLTLKTLIKDLKNGQRCLIFPEGRKTQTGSLMKIYETPGMLADKADALILPIRIERKRLTIQAPQRFATEAHASQRQRRAYFSERIYTILSDMVFTTSHYQQTLYQRFLQTCKQQNCRRAVLEDIRRQPLSLNKLRIGSLVLGKFIKRQTTAGRHIGLLLPNTNATVAMFLGLQLHGRIPAMLNYSAGVNSVLAACTAAEIKVIYSSRQFIAAGQLEPVIEALEQANIQIIYLEELQYHIDWRTKFKYALFAPFTKYYYAKINPNIKPDDPAVILFTSGSEGTPKGVVLSHKNILANCEQLAASIDFNRQDIIFNALPLFHAFGLTAGMLLPVLSGVKVFLYPSPLHYRKIPEYIYATNATVLFGTDTFLANYAQQAHPYDFYSVRYIFAGAERLKPETETLFMDKFGLRLFEGYGATETSPILSVNTPMHYKPDTVGRLLPGIKAQLRPVEGIEYGGRLCVAGPNVMLGYLKTDKPGVLQRLDDDYYDTGDIVSIDDDGYITLQGRAKRFAKIAGEMVSLRAVEIYLSQLWPQHQHAVIRVPDAKKGEQLVLITTYEKADRSTIVKYAKANNISELWLPRHIICVAEMPLLGSGKTDYAAVTNLWQTKSTIPVEATACPA